MAPRGKLVCKDSLSIVILLLLNVLYMNKSDATIFSSLPVTILAEIFSFFFLNLQLNSLCIWIMTECS